MSHAYNQKKYSMDILKNSIFAILMICANLASPWIYDQHKMTSHVLPRFAGNEGGQRWYFKQITVVSITNAYAFFQICQTEAIIVMSMGIYAVTPSRFLLVIWNMDE